MKNFLLIFLCISVIVPAAVSAVCVAHTTDDCVQVYPPPPMPTTCRQGDGSVVACCNNMTGGVYSMDNCPIGGDTPTPRPGCGDNNAQCCPGAVCHDATNTCFSIPDLASYCLTAAQIDAWNKKKAEESDTVNRNCPDPNCPTPGIRTALGCVPACPKGLIGMLIGWTAGLGGGVSLLMIFYAGFVMTTAGGDVKKVNSSKTILVSAIAGLVIIILAVVILNFIGFRIFGLNQFGFGV